jgi:hypothetical protein
MTRGRKRKKKCSSSKSTDENNHSHTGQGEEIATPPAQHTSPRRGKPEELTELHPSNTLQTEPEIGKDYYYAASAVSPNVHHQGTRALLFTIDHVAKPLANAAQTLEDQHSEEPESQQLFCDCLTQVWHRDLHLYVRQLEEYSNKAHLSTVMAAIQYSETLPDTNLQNQDEEVPDYEPSDDDDEYSCLQNPTKAPIISKDFLKALPHCPIIHWASQMRNDPKLRCCPCSIHSKPWMKTKCINS